LELRGELNFKRHVQVASLVCALHGHALILNKFASLRSDLLVARNGQRSTIECSKSAWYAFKDLLERDSLRKDQVVALPAVAVMGQLFEFDDKVCIDMAW